jgi:hypothetical protein
MTDREKFFDTVGILVEAYLNGVLMHGDCAACAVGNIISAKLGCKITSFDNEFGEPFYAWKRGGHRLTPLWGMVFVTGATGPVLNPKAYMGNCKLQIDASGYSWQDLARIESAFERAANYNNEGELLNDREDAVFNGLLAVVDVLSEIHHLDLSTREEAKLMFVKS